MTAGQAHRAAACAPRNLRSIHPEAGLLVLPPVTLRDLPPGGRVAFFLGLLALRFETPGESFAVFLHDFGEDDVARILKAQRREAEAQLGTAYARRVYLEGV